MAATSSSKAKNQRRDRPKASSEAARRRMLATRRRETSGETKLRSELRALGIRCLVDRPLPNSRRRADLTLHRLKVAIFVDGCFWHGCPEHGTWPRANAKWWKAKILANVARDRDTDSRVRAAGWRVLRVWEHEHAPSAAARIARVIRRIAERVDTK